MRDRSSTLFVAYVPASPKAVGLDWDNGGLSVSKDEARYLYGYLLVLPSNPNCMIGCYCC